MSKLELKTECIIDSIINVKQKRFGEGYVSIEDVLIIERIIELRLKRKNIEVEFTENLFDYFRIDNQVITRINNTENLKKLISEDEIKEKVYDESFIYYCLCEMLIEKLDNSMEHTCKGCKTTCRGDESVINCPNWSHNFIQDCTSNLSVEERNLIRIKQLESIGRL